MRTPRVLLRGFRPARELASAGLGPLERRVMDCLWDRPDASVRDVREFCGETAYTTVMTTLDRLFKKGLLTRRRRGRAFLYSPAASRSDFGRLLAAGMVEGLLHHHQDAPLPLLSNLVEAVGERDRGLLDELERLVREKQQELAKRGPR